MRILTIFGIFISIIGCTSNKEKEVKIFFTGDILLSRNIKAEIEFRKISPWYSIESKLKTADLVIGNLEGAVGSYTNSPDSDHQNIIFDIPKGYIPLLKQAGFTSLSIENNHSNDPGPVNKDSTILELNKAGLIPVLKNNSPWFYNIKNHTISIIAINLIPDKAGQKDTIPSIEYLQKLKLAKRLSEFVIVTIHWGSELLDWPNKSQRQSAKWLIDNGADLIIGHHPHVIQNPEIIEGRPVFYSLGNHLFDQKYAESKEGLLVECTIKNNKVSYSGIITNTLKNSYFPQINKSISFGFSKFKTRYPDKFYDYHILPASVFDGHEFKTVLTGYLKSKRMWTTPPISLISFSQADFDKKEKYIFSLEDHYSSIDNEIAPRPYVYKLSDTGLQALWRGSALSRPMIDAILSPDRKYLIALHKGTSFIDPNMDISKTRIEIYSWNGFGFSGYRDKSILDYGAKYYKPGLNLR
jgi:hypothetical protein